MAEFKKPGTEAEFEKNFQQIKPLMDETQAYYESSRCLFCYDAPCINACPTHINIPLFIRQINSGNTLGSAKTIYDSNYFGFACGKVCPTEVLCEGACVYTVQDIKPIEIGRLQSYATSVAIKQKKKLFVIPAGNGKKVAVIGAGPASVSCACELRTLGYAVELFEAKSFPSGLTIYGVAPYKISNEDALNEMNYLQEQFGFKVFYNNAIKNKKDLERLEKNYDAVFIGIGLGKTSQVDIPGENKKNCIGAVEFIEQLRMNHHTIKVGKKVVVLGAGNTSMDAASESARMGAEEVILAYRRSKENMPAYEFEYDLAKSVGVKGLFNVAPVEIIGNDKVEGVKFIQMKSISTNGDRKSKLEPVPNSDFVIDCDMVIKATGQSKQIDFLQLISNLKLVKSKIEVNPETYQTTNPKYFAAGDVVNGGKEVVNAVAEAKIAAHGIHKYLNNR